MLARAQRSERLALPTGGECARSVAVRSAGRRVGGAAIGRRRTNLSGRAGTAGRCPCMGTPLFATEIYHRSVAYCSSFWRSALSHSLPPFERGVPKYLTVVGDTAR